MVKQREDIDFIEYISQSLKYISLIDIATVHNLVFIKLIKKQLLNNLEEELID